MTERITFDLPQILRILPHRAPFVLLDRVIDIQPRQSARAIKCVTYNEPFFPGHFPDKPIFPGVMILEALAQLVGVLAYAPSASITGRRSCTSWASTARASAPLWCQATA